jgi:glycosyltransferase involved in cell wall biosynthesis
MSERLAVIILAHNEAETIVAELRAVYAAIVQRHPDAELIVAEDGSRDGTRDRILELARDLPLRLVGGTERLGYTRAVEGALRASDADWIFLCDAGLKHDPEEFWSMWSERSRFDLISGRKTRRQDQWYRRVFTAGFNALVRQLFACEVFDSDSGMRLLRRSVVDTILRRGLTFRGFSSTEIVLRASAAGYRYGEVPVSYRERAGESRGIPLRAVPKIILRGVQDLLALRRELSS